MPPPPLMLQPPLPSPPRLLHARVLYYNSNDYTSSRLLPPASHDVVTSTIDYDATPRSSLRHADAINIYHAASDSSTRVPGRPAE